jgi:hypothetical protein
MNTQNRRQSMVSGHDRNLPRRRPPCPSYRLLVCLIILGWSERELARRADRHQTTITRWVKGLSPVPGEEAAWLETLVSFHVAHPAPRVAQVLNIAQQDTGTGRRARYDMD